MKALKELYELALDVTPGSVIFTNREELKTEEERALHDLYYKITETYHGHHLAVE